METLTLLSWRVGILIVLILVLVEALSLLSGYLFVALPVILMFILIVAAFRRILQGPS